MSVFNGERYLKSAIESILTQTFKDFEFIIIDDCSTDSSLDVIKEFASRDGRISCVTNEKNRGLAWSLNRGISCARGNFIARMDADDISLPERLARQIEAFQQNPDLDMVACAFKYIDESGSLLRQGPGLVNDLYRLWILQFHNVYIHSSVMFRKSVGTDYYDEKIDTAQDYDYWCRIAKKDNIKYLDIPLVHYRVSTHQVSQLRLVEQKRSAQVTSFQNLRLCNPRLSHFEIQNVYRLYNSRYITLKDVKFIPTLFSTLLGFFQRYEISIRDRASLILLVSKDMFYWLWRNYSPRYSVM
ncbi:MAG: glycosyltransferase [Saprospiraceae bacterium]|nr:MAG: glycosyltransferase [Saprospiraceae bacterium]